MNEQQQCSTESPYLFSYLPGELIPAILVRLPVRSLLRFKSVCKSWHSLISDPKFGKSHYDLAAAPTHRCLTKGNESEIESIDVDAASLHNSESCVVNLKLPLPPPRMEYRSYGLDPFIDVEFVGSCRGFVLVAYPLGDVFVWNPSTGEQRRIADDHDGMIDMCSIGFGYDRSTDDYLLVLMQVIHLNFYDTYPDQVANDHTIIRIFSMKTNSWFDQEGTYAQYVDMGCAYLKIAAFLNDALHWLVTSYETKLHVIIAFHLVQRNLSEIPLPQVLVTRLENNFLYYLRVIGECLSLCYPGNTDSTAEIWMMKDYKVQTSWTKLFIFSTCNIPRDVIHPICFTKHGELFCSYGSGGLMIVDDKGWQLLDESTKWPEPHMMFGEERECILPCGLYRESLLSLPNDFQQANENDQLMISLVETNEDDK
ncbi:F-box/kelch-repeat protein At3g23880-like [Lotus japonicus]|uniref:F-box/kelch-repeat protein At3g23880-like n=1 Tax=Lotus japonicus TaxID=34305 RepID=UPI00258C79C0|nr:F-box/kelch-repeat protein At3g23880-like [Lotus japonicus]